MTLRKPGADLLVGLFALMFVAGVFADDNDNTGWPGTIAAIAAAVAVVVVIELLARRGDDQRGGGN